MEWLAFIALIALGIYYKVKALDELVGGVEDGSSDL